MIQKSQTPRGEARGSEIVFVLPGDNDCSEHKQNLIDLQAERLRRRFVLSRALAIATAELAFENARRFA